MGGPSDRTAIADAALRSRKGNGEWSCRAILGSRRNPSTKNAELIAFRVGEYHPRRVTLPDIGPPSTEGKETFDFCGLIDRTEVKMESVLACLLLWNRHEQQARHSIRSRPDLELVRGVAYDNPAQGLGPPSTKRNRIVSIHDDLLPNEIHIAHSARSVSIGIRGRYPSWSRRRVRYRGHPVTPRASKSPRASVRPRLST